MSFSDPAAAGIVELIWGNEHHTAAEEEEVFEAANEKLWEFDPPVVGGFDALFGPGSSDEDATTAEVEHIRRQMFPGGAQLRINELQYHPTNAGFVWKGAVALAAFLARHRSVLAPLRVLELGAATGAVAVYARAHLGFTHFITSDLDDPEISKNIKRNTELNGLGPELHVPHTWGERIESLVSILRSAGGVDVVVASDILLYTKAYVALVSTLRALFGEVGAAACFMHWGRSMKCTGANSFFAMCLETGTMRVRRWRRMYVITPLSSGSDIDGKDTDWSAYD